MKELKSFKDLISPTSWLFMWLLVLFIYPVMFAVGWKVFLVAAFIDISSFGLIWKINLRGLHLKRPLAKYYFENLNIEAFERLSLSERTRMVEDLFTFPEWWARRSFAFSLVKMTLPAIWILYAIPITSPLWVEILKMIGVATLLTTYLTSAIFIESHGLASRYLHLLHHRIGLKDVFDKVSIPPPKAGGAEFRENVATGVIWAFMLILQTLLIGSTDKLRIPLFLSVPLLGVICFALVTRI